MATSVTHCLAVKLCTVLGRTTQVPNSSVETQITEVSTAPDPNSAVLNATATALMGALSYSKDVHLAPAHCQGCCQFQNYLIVTRRRLLSFVDITSRFDSNYNAL
jgi:hypothetical protein